MLIFIRGKRCHMPFKLLTINKTDDTAIHHVTLVCFILRLKCAASVSSLWFYQSIHSSQPECVCDEREACRWKDYWRFLSGEESQCSRGSKGMESGKDGRSNDKCRLFWWFICGSIDGFNEFMNMVCSLWRIFSVSSAPLPSERGIFKKDWHGCFSDVCPVYKTAWRTSIMKAKWNLRMTKWLKAY